ncbi:hypothetical protein LR48_Vigan04g217700 [Vigna angularis]|uniref:Pentatricopeptide repeat-containing protein n=1 Tax=Phaseolus angularis TaxID=3914 RepID=A0A0L9UHH2_PHAAN|nr:hypothetical protein LR48_Vigan04g217700 [Vigna angularis]
MEIGDGSTEEYLHSSIESLEELMENSDYFMEISNRPSVNELERREIVMSDMEMDVPLETTLFDMYAKCGKFDKTIVVFYSMDGKNLQSCTVMMTVLVDHGRYKDPLWTGRRYFDRMVRMYGIKTSVEHYGCKVDLLGRSGFIQEAYDIIKGLPMERNGVISRSFLAACRHHGWVPSLDADLLSELEHELGAAVLIQTVQFFLLMTKLIK